MKRRFQLFGAVLFAAFVFTACSKDTDPADSDVFVGKYKGTTSYSDGDKTIASGEGTVEVIKLGDRYRFVFNRNIPDFGEEFKRDGNSFISVGSNGFTGITINEKKLTILVSKDSKTWTANCTR